MTFRFWDRVTSEGFKPDDEKVIAITKMENPKNVEEIRRLQRTVTYLVQFMPRLSDAMEPIRH